MHEGLASGSSLTVSFLLAAILVVLHLMAPRFRRLSFVSESTFASFSGGFAVAFVFLHMLPGLVENKHSVGSVLYSHLPHTQLADAGIFLLALLGFTVFFWLKRWVRSVRENNEKSVRRSFFVSIGSFGVYNATITFTMPERVEIDLLMALVFTLVIGLHFIIIDREHEIHETILFNRWGRYVLAGALGVGWLFAVMLGEYSVLAAAFISSFLAGSVLMNVFHYELSEVSDSKFGAFLTGISSGTALLLIVYLLEQLAE